VKFSLPKFQLVLLLILAAFSAGVALTYWALTPSFYFEVSMRSSTGGVAQTFYDIGRGISEPDSVRLYLRDSRSTAVYRFPLPEAEYKTIRFDPLDHGNADVVINYARIVDIFGHTVRRFSLKEVTVASGISASEIKNGKMLLTLRPEDNDSILIMNLGAPLTLHTAPLRRLLFTTRMFFLYFLPLVTTGILWLVLSNHLKSRYMQQRWLRVTTWVRCHPRRALLLVAAMSTVISCYPVVFFGKSFLSPNNQRAAYLLYERMPTVPGYRDTTTDDSKGADMGAPMYYSWPTSVVESRALLRDHELPLWNRYDSTGVPLLGQGQSMFGDPLHFLVLLTNGSAGWWDLKYILAKLLFAFSISLCVLAVTKHTPAAAIMAASSPFIGFFSYRYAHPAFFSLCYAPLILLCWLELIEAPRGRPTAFWLGAMAVANWMVLNSGTVKEAYILLLAMNFCGLLILLFGASTAREKRVKLLQAVLLQVLFVIIATPIWVTFLSALKKSLTAYSGGAVWQLQPSLLIGLFDEIFYRQFSPAEVHFDPAANFLTLFGVLWFCISPRSGDDRGISRGLGVTCLLSLAMVFGVVPPRIILRLPFLRNIFHIDNTFSCVAIICLLVLAGLGLKGFWQDCDAADFKKLYLRMAVAFTLLIALYLGTAQAARRHGQFKLGEPVMPSRFFWGYSLIIVVAVTAIPWLARRAILSKYLRAWHVASLLGLFVLLHWLYAMHLKTPFDAYVMNPHERVPLIANSSPALQLIKSRSTEPFRSAGLGATLHPGYGAAVGIEQIDGADALVNSHFRALMNAAGIKLLNGGWRYEISSERLANDLPLFNMLNIRYILAPPTTPLAQIPDIKNIASLDLTVYESERVWPRAFFTDRLFTYQGEEQFIQALKTSGKTPFAAIAKDNLKTEPSLNNFLSTMTPSTPRQTVAATDYALTTNGTSFSVKAPGPGVVVLTEAYMSHDFQLRVNGRPENYFRIDSAFKGFFVPRAGDYDVSFVYWPRYFTLLLVMSGVGIAALASWLVVLSRSSPSVS
jgi:hypothetical protein